MQFVSFYTNLIGIIKIKDYSFMYLFYTSLIVLKLYWVYLEIWVKNKKILRISFSNSKLISI